MILLGACYVYFRLNNIYSSRYALHTWIDSPAWARLLYTWRWLAILVAFSGILLLIWGEYRAQRITFALGELLRSPSGQATLILSLAVVSGSYYLQPGSIGGTYDAKTYLGWAGLLREYFAHGEAPIWSNAGGLGFPFTRYYAWFSYVPVALAGLVIHDVGAAARIALFILHTASVGGMYLYVREITCRKTAGLVSAFAHAFGFYIYHKLVLVGLLPMSLPIYLLPWQFYFAERMRRGDSIRRAWALTALATTLSIGSHLGYGTVAAAMLIISLVVRGLIDANWDDFPAGWSALIVQLAAPLTGILGASLFLIPPLTDAGSPLAKFLMRDHFATGLVRFEQVFTFSGSYLTPEWWGGYVGLSVLCLALAGAALGVCRRYRSSYGLIAVAFLSAWLVFGPYYAPFFNRLHNLLPFGSYVYGMHTPGYYVIYLGFALTVLSGFAVHLLARERFVQGVLERSVQAIGYPHSEYTVAFVLGGAAIAVVGIELVPLTLIVNAFLPPAYARQQTERDEAIAWITAHAGPPARVLESGNPYLLDIFLLSGAPQIAGSGDDLPPSFSLAESIGSPDTLYLANVGTVLTNETLTYVDPIPDQPLLYANDTRSPLIASRTVKLAALVTSTDDAEALIDAMSLETDRNTAEVIFVTNPEEVQTRPGSSLLEARALTEPVDLQNITLTYEVSDAAFVQLAYSWNDNHVLMIDGAEKPAHMTALGLIGFWSEAGRHSVSILPRLDNRRLFWGAVSAVILIGLMIMTLLPSPPSHVLASDDFPSTTENGSRSTSSQFESRASSRRPYEI